MNYKDIEIEWMKELLKENEKEIFRLRKENRNLRQENERLKWLKIMGKTVEEWIEEAKKFYISKWWIWQQLSK